MQITFFRGGTAAMAVVLALSNYLVLLPLGEWLTWGAFSYPLVFLVTDCVNRAAGAACARRVIAAGFIFGVPLSFFTNYAVADSGFITAARVAAASGAAFAGAQLLDVAIFNRLRNASWWLPPLASSATASVIDTFLFFALAFAGLGLPWMQWAAGDLAVKALMVAILLPPYRFLTLRLLSVR